MKYKFINANTDLGTHVDGSSKAPKLITKNFNNYEVINIDSEKIKKEKNTENKTKNLKAINIFNKLLFNKVTNIIKDGYIPIAIGGDHSLAIGSVLASSTINDDIGIIWIDAHADYNTIRTTITGNVHGLPLAAINGHNKYRLTSFFNPQYIKHNRTVIVGARSIDPLEKINLEKDNITVYTTEDIKKYGVDNIMDKAIKQAMGNSKKLHISYDLDVIDPKVSPGVSIPEVNGISLEEAEEIMEYINNYKKNITSLDLVEYNPDKDINNKTLNIAIKLLNIFLTNDK